MTCPNSITYNRNRCRSFLDTMCVMHPHVFYAVCIFSLPASDAADFVCQPLLTRIETSEVWGSSVQPFYAVTY